MTVTFEFINTSACDLGLIPSVSSLALDKHSILECGSGVGDVDELDSDWRYIVVTLVNHTVLHTAIVSESYICIIVLTCNFTSLYPHMF